MLRNRSSFDGSTFFTYCELSCTFFFDLLLYRSHNFYRLAWMPSDLLDFFLLRSRVRIEVQLTENDSTRLYKNGDISVVITRSQLKFGR